MFNWGFQMVLTATCLAVPQIESCVQSIGDDSIARNRTEQMVNMVFEPLVEATSTVRTIIPQSLRCKSRLRGFFSRD